MLPSHHAISIAVACRTIACLLHHSLLPGFPSTLTMTPMSAFIASCLVAVLVVHTASAFIASPVSMLQVPSANYGGIPVASRASYKLRSKRSLGALRMADEDPMEAAQETAKRLNDQAAALREDAASSEAEIRPTPEVSAADEDAPSSKAEPETRPEDMPPPQKISNDMKDRLRKELTSQGADPNKSAGNPILIVAAVIGLLVIVGGQGIFY